MNDMSDKKQNRPDFQSVEIDEIDSRLEQKALEKGIPTLVTPKAGEGQAFNQPVDESRDQRQKPRKPSRAQATPRARMRSLNIELPDYAWVELKTKAARQMVSVRHLIMSALIETGIEIKDEDMIEDGRRLRGSQGN